MGTKTLNRQKVEQKRRGASTPQEWRRLCRKALQAAQQVKDRRAAGLAAALETGREQQVLRKMSIICDNDITREFSSQKS